MERPIFKYDTKLSAFDLKLFEDLIGNSICGFRIENAHIFLPPNFSISNEGKVLITFRTKERGRFINLELTSIFKETPPTVESGGIAIRKIYKNKVPLTTIAELKLKQEKLPETTISYQDNTPVKSFKFYGSKERRELKDIHPNLDLDDLSKWGVSEFPKLEVDTIEFLIIEHESNNKTIITTNEGGFSYKLLIKKPIDNNLLSESYVKPVGLEKQIVLQHEVS